MLSPERQSARTLSPERQSARMSKITNGGLTRSGTESFFIAVPITATVGVKGLKTLLLTCLLAYLHSPHLFTQAHWHVHATWLQLLNLADHPTYKEVRSLVIRYIDHTSHQYSDSRENRRTLPWSKYWMTS